MQSKYVTKIMFNCSCTDYSKLFNLKVLKMNQKIPILLYTFKFIQQCKIQNYILAICKSESEWQYKSGHVT